MDAGDLLKREAVVARAWRSAGGSGTPVRDLHGGNDVASWKSVTELKTDPATTPVKPARAK